MTTFIDANGNLLTANVNALVNTVNTVGVMGKGIALQFKKAFPANFEAYAKACRNGEVVPGSMFVFDRASLEQPRWIINFPTKRHWRSKSKMADIETGLEDLRATVERLAIESIAVPPLGCGNGGLNWSEVEPLIRSKLGDLDLTVLLYAPGGTPQAADMPDRRKTGQS